MATSLKNSHESNNTMQLSLDVAQYQQSFTIAVDPDHDNNCTFSPSKTPHNTPKQSNMHNKKMDFSANATSMIQYSKDYEKISRKKNKKRIRSKTKNRNTDKQDTNNGSGRTTKISQIEIYDIINDDDLEYKAQLTEEKSVHKKRMEVENNFNDNILKQAKRPFYVLIFITILFIAVFVMNFVQELQFFVFNGLLPSSLSILTIIPFFICFKYFESKIIFQHKIIYSKIMETYSLNKKLQNKIDENLQQKKYIDDLKLAIKELEIEINKLNNSSLKNCLNSNLNLNLLHGFRKGQMEIQIEFADISELINMFSIIVSCITLLPFGMVNYRTKLKRILEEKIEKNKYLQQHFYFFMLSYLQCIDVQRLFRKHKMIKKVKKIADFYYNSYIISDTLSETCVSVSESVPIHIQHVHNNNNNDTFIFTDKNPIKLFRAPFDHFAKVGFTVIVAPQLKNRFYDPINGNLGITKLRVRSIFNSNAKPYLIDCYCANMNEEKEALSSSFILKKGDDLRKDVCVLQMFKFMNCIWKENGLRYKEKHFVSCLIYKVIPIGIDYGIIEIISNCIELNKIMTLKSTLFTANCSDNKKRTNKFHRLIASSAGSFVASFVCGIRDRHDDNILINIKKCILFHIDYGYIFNNKVSLDAAKFAITSDLKKIFSLYKYGWDDFVKLCVNSWMILRQNASELIDYARVVFAFLYQANEIELFLRESLKLDMNNEKAKQYITNKIQNAPKQWKTKMKNLVHGFAQKMKS